MATFDEFITSLNRDFGEQGKGKPFEVFCKWFLQNDPEWSGSVEEVWLWDEYPNKWQGKDLGTDLVFRDNEGQIWAVQAKCYSQHRSTTKKDLNSFLADAGREQVHRMLWMQTTDNMEANAEASLKHRDKPVTIFKLTDFRGAQIDYPASFAELRKASVKPKPRPEPHQIEAIEAAAKGLSDTDRGQMIMACGTGKTFTTLWVKEALNAHTTLVLLPSLSLLSQTMREWAWATNQDFKILNVCSDSSVGKKTEDMDPADAPFPVTSEVEEIALFLKKPEAKVIFCTYQSSALIAQAQLDESIPSFDLAVADEAHRCAGKADAGFATILDADKIRANKRLFTTATPRYFGKAIKDAANARDLEVVGMDNDAVFGPVVHKLSFGEAIERELLTDYQVVIVGVDEPMVREWIERGEIVATDPDNQTDARTLAAKIGLIKAIKDYDLKRVISFHSRVKGAKEFSEELADVINLVDPEHRPSGVFLSDYVSGEMQAGERKGKIDRLKALDGYDRGILTNARCLAEGVDVPYLDGVAFIDPRGSQIEIIQAVGRAIRKVRGAAVQKIGTIVIPVFIEQGDDHEASIEASNFKPVWDVLKALKSHDEVLAETLDQYRTNMAKNASQNRERISDKIIFDLPTTVDVEFSAALRTVLVEATTASWEFWFGLLEEYVAQFGNALVPDGWKTVDGYALGGWCRSQRQIFRKGLLDPKKQVRLHALRGWSWSPFDDQWFTSFQALKRFSEETGHSSPEAQYIANDGLKLGMWVVRQRVKRKQLSSDRIDLLEALPHWAWSPRDTLWENGYEHLIKHAAKNGGSNVIVDYVCGDGFKLGVWVRTQRDNWHQLDENRRKRLEAITGWVVDPVEANFSKYLNALINYSNDMDGAAPPTNFVTADGLQLGLWCSSQRSLAKKANYSEQKRKALDQVRGWTWDARSNQWEEGFRALLGFKRRCGHCMVPQQHNEDGFALGTWVSIQRGNVGQMSEERRQRLDEIDFVWDPLAQAWEEGFRKLEAFAAREGNCRVPKEHIEDGFNLGNWVSVQRRSKLKMSADRLSRLASLGFVWDSLFTTWNEGYQKLEAFKQREGHCMVSKTDTEDGFKLGIWIGTQRKNKDKLPTDKRQKLDALGFTWDPLNDAWKFGYEKLKAFKAREGHCRVPQQHIESGFRLGQWVGKQRQSLSKLSQERRERLDAIGFVWSTK